MNDIDVVLRKRLREKEEEVKNNSVLVGTTSPMTTGYNGYP